MASSTKSNKSKTSNDENIDVSESYNPLPNLKVIVPPIDMMNKTLDYSINDNKSYYHEAPIMFNVDGHTSDVLKVENVGIPCCEFNEKRNRLLYVCLPQTLGKRLQEAAMKHYSLDTCNWIYRGLVKHPDNIVGRTSNFRAPGEWWRLLEINYPLGYISRSSKSYKTFDLSNYFKNLGKGLRASLFLRFFCQSTSLNTELLNENSSWTMRMEIVKGCVTSVDPNLRAPLFWDEDLPALSERDLASEDVLDQLAKYTYNTK